MNFLAHSYLSFNHPDILVGNMISDFVKGKTRYNYPQGVQHGITLHREIDAFTDNHPATRYAKTFLKPAAGLYAGAFIDVVYDHFLANDTSIFHTGDLAIHADNTYSILKQNEDTLPPVFRQMLPFMISQNWLYNYRYHHGTQSSFGGLVRRAKYLQTAEPAFQLFNQHYNELQKCYNDFFPSVKTFAWQLFQKF